MRSYSCWREKSWVAKDPGRTNYQIAVGVCSACGQGAMRANGEVIAVAPEVIERAECDAQKIQLDERPHVGSQVGQSPRATRQVPPEPRFLYGSGCCATFA